MVTVVSNNLNILILNKGIVDIWLYCIHKLACLLKIRLHKKRRKKKKHLIQKIALKQDSYFNLIANILKFLP